MHWCKGPKECSQDALQRRLAKLIARHSRRWRQRDLRIWLAELGYSNRRIAWILDFGFFAGLKAGTRELDKKIGSPSDEKRRAAKELKER